MSESTRRRRGALVTVMVALAVGGALLAPATATADRVRSGRSTPMHMAAGGFGLPQGALSTTVKELAPVLTEDSYASSGGCAGYANSVGVSLYCGNGSGQRIPSLREMFPGVNFNPCKVYPIPAGMKPPRNQTPSEGRWYLQACLSGIEWDEPYGGTDLMVTLTFVYVHNDEPDPTDPDLSPDEQALSDLLWNQAQTNYPVPFVTARPTHIPRVNVMTWFQFRWLDSENRAARRGPYADNPDGGPYLELSVGGVTLRARSVEVRINPEVEGMPTRDCGAVPEPYDQTAEPTPEAQESDCYVTFEHSSAAAEELTQIELPPLNPDYPVPMYVISVEVDWHVEMFRNGQKVEDLGVQTFTAYQQLPVTEVPGLVGSEASG